MKKICVITTVHAPNDTRVYYKETRSLAKLYEVVYIAPDADLLKDNRIKLVNIIKPQKRLQRILNMYNIFRLCIKQNCECYHLQDPELIIVGLLLKIIKKKKVIYDVHEDYPDYILQKEYLPKWSRYPLALIMKTYEYMAALFFDAIVVADNFVFNRFPIKKTIILYNFPDLSVFTLSKATSDKKYDLIYPGSLSREMVNIIISLVKEILKVKKDLRVLLVSPFDMSGGKEWVKQRIIEEKINEEVFVLMDRVPYTKVCSLVEESRIGLIPLPNTKKFLKNIPTKLFEYMYCKIPVVANDLPPSRQFVEGKDCCYLVDIHDPVGSTSIILNLLSDKELQRRLGINGNRLVVEKYNWEREEKKLHKLYKGILGE